MVYIANIIHPNGNGYCIVSADNPKQAESIIRAQSRYHDARIADFKKLCWQDTDTHIIYEGAITTLGKNAYDLAVKHGFRGTVEDWLKSLKGEKGEAGEPGSPGQDAEPLPYKDWDEKSKEELVNSVVSNVDFGIIASTQDIDELFKNK